MIDNGVVIRSRHRERAEKATEREAAVGAVYTMSDWFFFR